MNKEKAYNKQLIRWLEGELKGEELSVFEASPEFKAYQKIIDTADDMSYPKMNEALVFENIQQKIADHQKKESPSKVINLRRLIMGVAAIAVLGFAVMNLIPQSIDVNSGVGQYISHTLPDGSEINLNGKSTIHYKKNFKQERTLSLEGEAFFEVQKGESFIVQTKAGSVSVLGTSFNVFSRNDIFIVSCKTGKVKVEAEQHTEILEAGERIKIYGNHTTGKEIFATNKIGSWLEGTSYFSNSRLEEVILSMSSHYDIAIELPEQFRNERFTGSFVHNDIEKALKMVFSPMGISYSINESGEVHFTDQ